MSCSLVQLSSTIGCCLFCFFLVYRPSSTMLKLIPGPKPPHLLVGVSSRVLLHEFANSDFR